MKNRVLVIGSGGREHAIVSQIKKSKLLAEIFCIPGNGGIENIAKCFPEIKPSNHEEIIDFCNNYKIDLVVIGPEQPLVEGLADSLKNAKIKVFGPSKLAARLEGSKIFTKEICDEYNIPTARYQSFNNAANAIEYLNVIGVPCVIKADGIAAGKGVIIAQNKEEAIKAIEEIFGGKFGSAGKRIIIEEFLEGPEVSFFAVSDGKKSLFFGTAGDHKKVGEGEVGANTGGMGAYSPSPLISKEMREEIMVNIIHPTLKAMNDKGYPFSGILFAGLILTKNGPKLLEYNVRLGDPEAEAILPRLKSDLLELMLRVSEENLNDYKIEFSDNVSITVVLAAKGYPDEYQKGTEIKNLSDAEKSSENIIFFHAGTKKQDDKILANGGRVIAVTALASDIRKARDNAYKAIDLIDWPDGFCRKDIGFRILN